LFTAHSVCGKKPKNIEISGQLIKNFDFFAREKFSRLGTFKVIITSQGVKCPSRSKKDSPEKMLKEGNQIPQFYAVSMRTFVIPFYYVSGSGTVIHYNTVPVTLKSIIKLRFRFCYGKLLLFLRFWSGSGSATLQTVSGSTRNRDAR
jgi:hypothetical protein